jgi:hypothetical protein
MTGEQAERDWSIVDGEIKGGDFHAETVEYEGEVIELGELVHEDDVYGVLLEKAVEAIKDLQSQTVMKSDLREVDSPSISAGTKRAAVLSAVVHNFPATSDDIAEHSDKKSVASCLSALRSLNYIAVVDTEEKSYSYIPTHKGINAAYEMGNLGEKNLVDEVVANE